MTSASSATSLEIEVKVAYSDSIDLSALALEVEVPRHFEDNWMLDTVDQQLKAKQSALRVRFANGRAIVTFKGVSTVQSEFKAREEIETEVAEPTKLLAIFARLGYRPFFRYQKYRTTYRVHLSDTQALKLMVDETPMGNFLELEGSEAAITEAVQRLQLSPASYITATYIGLQVARCTAASKPLEDLVFEEQRS
jgi:adenylate cyclase class 2